MSGESSNFPQYFFEQGFVELLLLSAALAAGFLVLLALFAWAASVRFGIATRVVVVASAVALGVFVLGFTLFEAAALYFRYEPHGYGSERQGADREQFVSLAKIGFTALYVSTVSLAAAVGYMLTRRQRTSSPRWAALVPAATVAIFLAATLPFADFANACNVGEGFILTSAC